MNNNEQIKQDNTDSRRKFVWGVGILSVFAAVSAATGIRFNRKKDAIACKPETKKRTLTMLTQDGKLVEVDETLLTAARTKITNSELQNWIKK
jgi:hypothetical protein